MSESHLVGSLDSGNVLLPGMHCLEHGRIAPGEVLGSHGSPRVAIDLLVEVESSSLHMMVQTLHHAVSRTSHRLGGGGGIESVGEFEQLSPDGVSCRVHSSTHLHLLCATVQELG